MAKSNKEKQKMVQTASMMPSLNSYDLSYVKGADYAPTLDILFKSEAWMTLFQHRNKLAKSVLAPGANKSIIFEGLKRDDRKAADMLLQTLFMFAKKMDNVRNARSVTLGEYFDEFIDTEEKKEAFNDFTEKIDGAIFCADIITGMLADARDALKKIDPETVLTEFDGVTEALKPLRDFSSLRHKDENQELLDLWCECADDVELAVYARYKQFMAAYTPLRDRLVAEGKIDRNSHRDKKNLY